jgi:LmbE family N-acetylglucosaminyl deacetylase
VLTLPEHLPFEAVDSDRLRGVLAEGAPVVFLSPHLDDAVLSCGALMRVVSGRCPLTVATVFTEAAPAPHTRAARSFLAQCSASSACSLFSDRRTEDREVLDRLGAAHRHLGFADALFRRRVGGAGLPTRVIGSVLPEVLHRYPTYRFDIARGRLARGDRELATEIQVRVAQLLIDTSASLLFCPVGVGRHVDHLLVRSIGPRFAPSVIYYADFPYSLRAAADPGFVKAQGLTPWTWDGGIREKDELIRGYRTQVDALFPTGRIPTASELYFSKV